jgi:hypothetical protein
VAMPWRVKFLATKQLSSGKLWQCASGADADGQGEDATQHAIARRQGLVGFALFDVDPDFDDLDSIKAMKELKQYGRVAEVMEELGVMVEQIRREGGLLKGLVNHYVFTGAPGTCQTSVARFMARVLFSYGVIAT